MATYTPNFNLSKPEDTDTQSSFISDYRSNMDTIDQNLGGGGGGGNVYGTFIDTSEVIKAQTIFVGSMSYTATKDCIVAIALTTQSNATALVKIDGVTVQSAYISNGTNAVGLEVPLKSGQVLTVENANSGNNSAYTVYGITQGTEGIFAPVIYSDNERVIGIWRDNKPLYAKTYHFTSGWVNDSWTDITDLSGLNIDTFVKSDFSVSRTDNSLQYTGNGSIRPETSGQNHTISARYYSNHLQVMVNNYNDIVRLDITILYTKTTDSAGSGNWNTDGIPMHHYSTNEQVIGTFVDGKPLYEKAFDGLSVSINGNNWVYYNDINYIDNLVDLKAYANNGGRYLRCAISEYQRSDTNGVMLSGFSGFNRTVNVLVLQYTKSTD